MGVDITKEYVEDATKQAVKENLPAQFLHMIRVSKGASTNCV